MKRGDSRSADDRGTVALLKAMLLFAIVFSTPFASSAQSQQPKHTVTITFDYDFTANHSCSPTVAKKCVARFNVYDISGGKPYKLFSLPAPAGANGPVKAITGGSQPLLFEPGKHLFAVTAQMASGEESYPGASTVWAAVP